MGLPKVQPEYAELEYVDISKLDFVSAPKTIERFGSVVDINVFGAGTKYCSFDCAYCSQGATKTPLNQLKRPPYPRAEEITERWSHEIAKLALAGTSLDYFWMSGLGEPTLHHDFPELVTKLIELRNLYFPSAKIAVFTNGAHLDQRKVTEATNRVDVRILKVDAGNDKILKQVDAPVVRSSISKLLVHAKSLKDCWVQGFFVQGQVDNTKPADIDDWMETLGLIKPTQVLLSTLKYVPAVSGLKTCDEDTLYGISAKLERKIGLRSWVL